MGLPAAERDAYLARIGASDPELVAEVQSLLTADESAGEDFLNKTPLTALGLATPETTFVGRRFGPYKLIEAIGSGGMGEVYKAVRADDEYHHEVAIKLVHSGLGRSFIGQRLRAERQILASLQHDNIARLLDGGTTEEGIPYLVMELIDGKSITEYCEEHKLDTTARLKLFVHVCAAVQYAHQRMVIHRDLKPSNILITRDGVPKLLDFGIAKIREPGTLPGRAEQTIAAMGILTPQYASPEQLKGETVTAASDVYSLGVILYELLTGVRPHAIPEQGPHELWQAVLDTEPRRPSTVVPDKIQQRLRGDLDNVVLMALRKEPERRYGNVDQFAADIRRHLEHRPVLARKATMGYVLSRFVARHAFAVTLSALFGVALIAGVAMIVREARIAEMHEARAERRFDEVRKMANALIFDIDDSIRDLAGAGQARRVLIDTALKYLGSLSEQAVGDPALQIEMAAAYKRLGDIQGSFQASQDDYAGASKSFYRALILLQSAIATDPENIRAHRDLTVVYNSLSDLLWTMGDVPGSLSYAKRALDDSEGLVSTASTHYDKVFWTSLYGMDYGYKLFRTRGDATTGLRYMRSAITILEPLFQADTTNVRTRRLLAVSYYKASEALLKERNYPEALAMNEKAIKVLDIALAAAPQDFDLHINEAAAKHYAAAALMNLGRLDEAQRYEEVALQRLRALVAIDPRVAEFQGFVSMALTGMADVAERRGQAPAAMTFLYEALTASETALAAGTKHPYIRHSKGKTEALLGNAYMLLAKDEARGIKRRVQDWQSAREWYQRALATFQIVSPIWSEAADDARWVAERIAECNRVLANPPRAT